MYVGSVSGLFDCPSGDVNRAFVTGAFWVGGEEAEVAAEKTSETRKEETDDNETEEEEVVAVVVMVVVGREEEEEEAAYDVISGPEDDASSIESLAELLNELTADVDDEDESLVWAEAADNQKQRIADVKTSCPRILPPRCVLSTGQK